MSTGTSTELASFHAFVARQLQSGRGELSPEEALALWKEQFDTIEALQEGLTAVEEGHTKPLEQFVKDFSERHGLADDA